MKTVTGILSLLAFNPLLNGGPTDTPESPLGWTVFAALRRLTDDDGVGERRLSSAADPVGTLSANGGEPMMMAAVASVNHAPTAVADSATIAEDTVRTFSAAQLVGNDTDPDGGVLSVHSVSGAVNGAVVLNADGTVTFTPAANFSGPASFTYRVKDAAGLASIKSAKVSVTVTPVNDAPTAVADSATIAEDTARTFSAAQLVGNDTDPDGGVLSVHSVSGAVNGAVVLNADGTVTFTPAANFSGPASFNYRVKDAAGLASIKSAKVSVTVTPVNDAPTAVADSATIAEDTVRTFSAAQLVGNDTDPDGGVLSVHSVSGAVNGAVVLNADGTVTFTPAANFSGPASFNYRVKDAAGLASIKSAKVSVTVTPVNDAPTAVADSATIAEDTVRTFSAAQLVGNDTDPDGGVLSVHSVSGAVNGAVVLNADGTVTFTPAANFSGPASFNYRVKDAAGLASINTANVSLTVTTAQVPTVPTIPSTSRPIIVGLSRPMSSSVVDTPMWEPTSVASKAAPCR